MDAVDDKNTSELKYVSPEFQRIERLRLEQEKQERSLYDQRALESVGITGMSPKMQPTTQPLATKSRIIQSAHPNDVLRDQLEYLIDHNEDNTTCIDRKKCKLCKQYDKVAPLLGFIFKDKEYPANAKS